MSSFALPARRVFLLGLLLPVLLAATAFGATTRTQAASDGPVDMVVEQLDGSQFIYVVFHALDRDGFCAPLTGGVSLHPVLGIPIDFVIESGDGIIIETSNGDTTPGRSADGVLTFSTALNAETADPIRAFPHLLDGIPDECQAWIKVSQSIPGPLRVLVTAPADNPGGKLQWVADLEREVTVSMTLNYRWSLVTWLGEDGVAPGEALQGANSGDDISDEVTAIYGWNASTQTWLAYFPGAAGIPGANDLTGLDVGSAYWTAIAGPGPVTWNVLQ